jgi:hypothetical protein
MDGDAMTTQGKKQAPVYTLEAGRSILRDGVRFASIGRAGPDVSPTELDTFARDVVAAMNARAAT